jgi:outer membrane protein OmpA-like peptidoglycan-associated protein
VYEAFSIQAVQILSGVEVVTFCTKCGQKMEAGFQFCTSCGAPAPATAQPVAPAGAQPPAPPSWQSAPVAAPQAFAPAKKRSGLALLLIVLAVLGLIAVVGIGGVVYVGYKVKEKVTSVAQQVTHPATPASDNKKGSPAQNDGASASAILGNLSAMLGGGSDDGDQVESISAKDPVTPCSGGPYPAQAAARIPLQEGTVITTAWGILRGDIEMSNSVSSTSPASLDVVDNDVKWTDDFGQNAHSIGAKHITCNEDFQSSDIYVTEGGSRIPSILHGITRLRLSSKSFDEVKSQGKTSLRYFYTQNSQGETEKPAYVGGSLARVEPQDVAYPMIVNDQRVNLPAIHLAGIMEVVGKSPFAKKDRPAHSEADIYLIDDPLDPLVLLLKIKDPKWSQGKFRIEVIRINYKTAQPVNLVEKQLTEQKRAVTYGIYFDFNKDTIKPESEPVLKEIVQAMTDNPDWKLTVEGNTDNIGGDAYNLDLSKRRAAAVKETLVNRYHIAADRLSTNGFGASHPIETNDTLEGRARNRRVELTRE